MRRFLQVTSAIIAIIIVCRCLRAPARHIEAPVEPVEPVDPIDYGSDFFTTGI